MSILLIDIGLLVCLALLTWSTIAFYPSRMCFLDVVLFVCLLAIVIRGFRSKNGIVRKILLTVALFYFGYLAYAIWDFFNGVPIFSHVRLW